jgi:putative membrane protein
MMWMHGWGSGGGFFPGPVMGLFWIGLLVVAVWGVTRILPLPTDSIANALAILEARFARGEIDRAEFEERQRILRG